MHQIRSWTREPRAIALAALAGWVAAGCGDEGPTGPKPTSLSDLFGSELYRADGSAVAVGALGGTAVIGIYFADSGCPACAGFTPTLIDAYNHLKAEGQSFEVVLVSPGISDSSLFDYMVDSDMPWLAVSSQSDRANFLIQWYQVRWVPTLIIIDAATNVISFTGREELVQNGPGIYEVWLAASTSG